MPSTPASLGVSPSFSSLALRRACRSRSRSSSWRLNFLPIRRSFVKSDIFSFCKSTTWSSASSGVRERARLELDRDPFAFGVLVLRFRGAGASVPSSCRDVFRWRFLGRVGSPSAADVVTSSVAADGFLAVALADVLEGGAGAGSSDVVPEALWLSATDSVTLGAATWSAGVGSGVGCWGVSIDGFGRGFAADCRRVRVLGVVCGRDSAFEDSSTVVATAKSPSAIESSVCNRGWELGFDC